MKVTNDQVLVSSEASFIEITVYHYSEITLYIYHCQEIHFEWLTISLVDRQPFRQAWRNLSHMYDALSHDCD
jgi:hypothetical protein